MSFSFESEYDLDSLNDELLDADLDQQDDGQRANGDDDIFAEYEDLYDGEDFKALGVDPFEPTGAKPGSSEKVLMLAARYASGLPLWHDSDCYDHGPGANGSRHDVSQN